MTGSAFLYAKPGPFLHFPAWIRRITRFALCHGPCSSKNILNNPRRTSVSGILSDGYCVLGVIRVRIGLSPTDQRWKYHRLYHKFIYKPRNRCYSIGITTGQRPERKYTCLLFVSVCRIKSTRNACPAMIIWIVFLRAHIRQRWMAAWSHSKPGSYRILKPLALYGAGGFSHSNTGSDQNAGN